MLATSVGFIGTAAGGAESTAPAPETQHIAPHGNPDLLDSTSTWKLTSSYPELTQEDTPTITVDSVEASDRTVPENGDDTSTVAAKESGTDDGNATTGGELALVDATVDDHEVLVRAARADGIPVVNVTSAADVRSALTNRSDLAAIHVFSHGSVGEVLIGDDRLTAETLDSYDGLTRALNESLAPGGDVMLYGCRVASDGTGQAFVDSVGTATGGDVAASDDLTGSADRDGDWHLEASSGTVSTAELSATGFSGVLSVPEDEDYGDNDGFAVNRPSGSPFTLDGVKYVVTGSNGPYTHSIASPPGYNGKRVMAFDQEDYSSNGGVSSIEISAANGNNFQLKSIELKPANSVTLESSSGGSIELSDDEPIPPGTTEDLSANQDFQDISSFSITGSDIDVNLIKLDFEPPVRPPTFDDGNPTLTVDEDAGSTSIDSLLSATDGNDGQTLTWTVVSTPSSGTLGGFSTSETSDGGSITPSGLTYTPDNDYSGADSFQVRVKDSKGYGNTVTVDVDIQDAPEVTSITRNSPASPTNADSVDFDVAFSESVSGVDDGDFTLAGSASGTVQSFGPTSGTTIPVTVGSASGDGDLRLDLADDDSITNGNGVPLGGDGTSGSADGSYTGDESFSIDTTAPSLTADSGSTDEDSSSTTIIPDLLSNDDDASTPLTVTKVDGSSGNVDTATAGDSGGQFTIDGSGQVDFDPNGEFESLSDGDSTTTEVSVTVADAAGNTNTQTVTATVNGVNDAPSITIGSDQTTTADTTEQTVTDFVTGFDPGGGESQSISDFTVINDDNALFATQPDINDGDLTYTPADGVDGTATVSVQVVDDGGTTNGGEDTSSMKTFDITVDTAAPSFSSGSNPSMDENTVSALDVNADDGSGTDTGVTYSLVGGADQSAFSIDASSGSLSFSNAPDYENPTDSGTDNSYVVNVQAADGVENTNTQPVTVTVDDVNEAPTLDTNNGVTVDEGSNANQITNSDLASSDPEGDTLTYSVTTAVSHGTLFVDGSGSGSDDGTLDSESAIGTDTFTQADIDNGNLLYSHDGSETSSDGFDFGLDDGQGNSVGGNTFSISVTSVNDAPTLSTDTRSLNSIDEDDTDNSGTQVSTILSSADSTDDPDGDTLGVAVTNVEDTDGHWEYSTDGGSSWTDVSTATPTASLLLADSERVRFVPSAEFNGDADVTLRAWDQTSGSVGGTDDTTVNGGTTAYSSSTATASITVKAVNDAPLIDIGSDQTTTADTTKQTVTGFATGFDPGGDESQSISDFTVTNDANTLFDIQPDISDGGSLTYTPADGVQGTATVSVQVVDNGGTANGGTDTSSTKKFDISVDTAAPSFSSVSNPLMDENTVNALNVNADDGSGTDTGVTYSLVGGADQSAFSIDSNTGALALSSPPDYESPTDSDTSNDYVVDVEADDGVGNTNTQTITVDVTDVDESPTAPDDSSQTTDEDSIVSVADGDSADLLELASDPDVGDALSFNTIDGSSFSDGTPVTLGSSATVTVDSDGSWTYDPNGQYESLTSGDSTTDSFTYTVADSDDDTAQGTVTVSITGVNDAPTAIGLTSSTVAQSGGTDAVVGSLSATDADDSSHTFSLVSGSGDGDNTEFNIDSDDLRADDSRTLVEGDYDVRLEAADGGGGTYEKAVTVSVTDDFAPTIASSTPADDATGVSESTDITITFSEDVAFGSGSVTLREDDGGFSDWETLDVSTDTGSGDGSIALSGSTLRIDPSTELASNTSYAVRIDTGVINDTAASPNEFDGIGDDTTLNFTTTDSISPTASVGPDTTVDEGESVSFDGTGSTDNVGITSHDWEFDDGDTASGATTTHTFDSSGTYEVELTVADALNNEATAIRTITVESTGGGGDDSSGGSSGPDDTDAGQPSADEDTTHVVTGTRSDDGTASFNVADSGGYGSITLDLRGTATGNSLSGAWSDGSDAGDGADTDAVVVDRLSIIPTESATREFELSVRTWPADSIESENETDDTGTDVTAPANQGETNDSVRTRTDPQASLDTTGSVPVGYVEVTHTNPDTDIENVTFRFRIQKAYLDERDVAPSAVALYRNETDGIVRLPTENVGSNGSYYLFESVSPGLSLFAIGSSGPTFVIERASGPADTLTISEPVTVDATVRNLGRAAGAYTAELRSNGTVVAAREVELAPNSTRTVSLSFTPADPGEYTLTVGTVVAGTVSVQSDEVLNASTPAPTEQANPQQTPGTTGESTQPAGDNGDTESATDASGPGFGVAVAFGVLLTVVIVLARRQS